MELSQSVLDGLTLAGDSAHVPDKSFSVLVTRALDGLLDERHRHLVASKACFGYQCTKVPVVKTKNVSPDLSISPMHIPYLSVFIWFVTLFRILFERVMCMLC